MTGVFLGSRAAARYMLPKRKGSIVNTASIMGLSAVASIQTSLIKQQKAASSI